jgi:dipeptidyl aminopeptidase/acylaminoacyl peptidase
MTRHKLTPLMGMLGLAVLVGGLLGYWLHWLTGPPQQVVVRPTPLATPQPSPGVVAMPYPLTIPAQRTRRYTGGDLHLEEDLGDRGGYRLSRVSYPSDGYRVYALMATPSTPRPVFGYPVVLVVHGYHQPETYQTTADYLAEMQALATHGYVAIKPDLRGHGQSWGVARGAYYSPDYTADVLNLTASLASDHALNSRSVGLFGHSMGGYVVMSALAIQPKRFKAAVIVNGAVGTEDDMYYNWQAPSEMSRVVSQAERQRVVKLFGEPKQNPDFWHSLSPLSYADAMTTPVQIHQGLADTTVPPRFATETRDALQAAHKIVEYYGYPGVGHVFAGAAAAQFLERSLPFYDRYVRP